MGHPLAPGHHPSLTSALRRAAITDADRARVAGCHRGRALLYRVDAGRGLTVADLVVLGDWLRADQASGVGAQDAETRERSAAARWVAVDSQAWA